jgi:putative flippase GtrA
VKLVFLYTIFAIVATLANIAGQELATSLYRERFSLWFSLLVGTAIGLMVKYLLDKRYIFRFVTRDRAHDGRTFLLYAIMGLMTTFIFWAFEFTFDHIFGTKTMRYTGGIIGLAIGYS